MRRARGMTLVEVMIATVLAGVVSASLLMMVRAQLIAYEANDQLGRAQQNARVAVDLLESMGRRMCAGSSVGELGINVPPAAPSVQPCLRVWEGAVQTGGTFTAGAAASGADAIEFLFASSPITKLTAAPNLGATPPTASVADVSGFSPGDLVAIGDLSTSVVLRIAPAGVSASGPAGPPTAGTLTFVAPGGALAVPANPALNLASTSLYAAKAYSYALYVETAGVYANMLMLDPDGMVGASHADAQPLASGVIDLQAAVGVDANGDGNIADSGGAGDDWLGNAIGEPLPAPPWNRVGTTDPQLRLLRLTVVVQTMNVYPGAAPALGPFEDRTAYPSTTAGFGPRYRAERVVVAPRVWNLLN
jgi:prepilin-type N-terminal cleavage/methylation domain-containing protein